MYRVSPRPKCPSSSCDPVNSTREQFPEPLTNMFLFLCSLGSLRVGANRLCLVGCRRLLSASASQGEPPPSPSSSDDPLSRRDFFGVHRLFTVSDLFRARVHLGHTHRSVDPRMRAFLLGRRFDTAIFDLDQTALHLRQALNVTAHIAAKGGVVLFVARQPHLTHLIERAAKECGEYAHCR